MGGKVNRWTTVHSGDPIISHDHPTSAITLPDMAEHVVSYVVTAAIGQQRGVTSRSPADDSENEGYQESGNNTILTTAE
jgi:hypothetical protein